MFKAICRSGVMVMAFVFLNVFHAEIVHAQAAKTIFAQVSGQVVDLSGASVPNATVRLDGPQHSATTADTSGHFVFANVPPGTYTVSATATGYTAVTRSGVAVQNEDVNLNIQLAGTTALKEIGHVTTSTGRSAINVTAAPSFVVTPSDMAFQGQTQWRKVLEEIPGVSISGVAGLATDVIPGSPINTAVVSIRGALPYETAMLIDNMPMWDTSIGANASGTGVDLSPYSGQTFGATDVIEGPGAQSPSIVGSIGGSLNFHPGGQVTKNSYAFSVSDDPFGGWIVDGSVAMHVGKLSATASYGLNNSPGPVLGTQEIFNSSQINAINGTPFSCPLANCSASNLFPINGTVKGNLPSAQQTGFVGCCTSDSGGSWVSHHESLSLFYQPSHAITVQFYFSDNNGPTSLANWQIPLSFVPPAGYAGPLPAGSVLQMNDFPWETTQVGQTAQIYEGKLTFQLGRGQLQLAALSNRTQIADIVGIPPSLGAATLYGGGCLASAGPLTSPCPAGFEPVIFNGTAVNNLTMNTLLEIVGIQGHNRDWNVNYATPLGDRARTSASIVHSFYDSSEYLNLFQQVGSVNVSIVDLPQANFVTNDEMRLSYGLSPNDRTSFDFTYYFANTRFHVVNPATASTAQFNLAQVLYQDQVFHYNAPRLNFVWRPTSSLSIRASTGGGFAPAPLGDLISSTAPSCAGGITCTFNIPNVNLRPETSWGYDVGFDKRFGQSTIASFDVYTTTLQGQVYRSLTQVPSCSTCLGLPTFSQQFNNLSQSRYQGITLDLHRDMPRGIVWSLSGALMRGYVVSLPAGFYNANGNPATPCNLSTNTNCINQKVLPTVNFNGLFTLANVPYAQGFAQYGYRWSPERFINVDMHYFGNNNGYYLPAFVVFDANAQVPVTKYVSLQGTLRNITGQYDAVVLNEGTGYIYSTAAGPSAYTFGVPYTPRTFLLTLRVHS